MKIALVIFVSLLFAAASAQSQPGQPTSEVIQPGTSPPAQTPPPPPTQPPAPQQEVQTQPEPQSLTTQPPAAQGRWIHTEEHGSVWIPKNRGQPPANGSAATSQAPEQPTTNSWVWVPKTAEQPPAKGQWVYTAQYGWLWMPYGIQYIYEPPADGLDPQAFVYYPTHGWKWVAAPWVWGWGVVPYYGYHGPWYFAWYRGPTYVHPGWGGYRGGWRNSGSGGFHGGRR